MTRINLEEAISFLKNGGVVAVPTETVYGLAASLEHPHAIDEIFRLKGRPSANPLIIHLASSGDVIPYIARIPPRYAELTHRFWPGPLTLVLPIIEKNIPARARAHLSTAAFRIPMHPLAHALLRRTGPLVMPSANISGTPSSTAPCHVESDFGADFPVLDGGPSQQGLESTILTYTEDLWHVIRLGAIAPEEFMPVLGYLPPLAVKTVGEKPLCPGQLYRHYAPKAHLHLTSHFTAEMTGAVIGFSDRSYPPALCLFSLGSSSSSEQAAEKLYGTLRLIDTERLENVHVDMDFPTTGLWKTLRERLEKSAARI